MCQEWLFVEEQLLDPTVVVDAPEILLPLQHLTSSLEMIAHYYLMRGLKYRAIETLERACPLMELIPVEVESEQHRACFELLTSIYFDRFGENYVTEAPSALSWSQDNRINQFKEDDVFQQPSLKPAMIKPSELQTSDVSRRLETIREPFEHLRKKLSSSSASSSPSSYLDIHGLGEDGMAFNDFSHLLNENDESSSSKKKPVKRTKTVARDPSSPATATSGVGAGGGGAKPSSEFDILAVKFVKTLLSDGAGPKFPFDYFIEGTGTTNNMVEEGEKMEGTVHTGARVSSMKLRAACIDSASTILRLAEETVNKLGQSEEGAERCRSRMVKDDDDDDDDDVYMFFYIEYIDV
jgi:hypothetical protein